jgi:hypothetical protein
MARKAKFDAELIEGHKGVTVVLVPFDPEDVWEDKPVRLAGRRHGWPVKGTIGRVPFVGYIGDRWGRFFILVEPEVREAAGAAIGDTLAVVIEPTQTATAVARAIEQSKATTQPKQARADVRETRGAR